MSTKNTSTLKKRTGFIIHFLFEFSADMEEVPADLESYLSPEQRGEVSADLQRRE